MKKEDEKIISELIKKYKLTDKNTVNYKDIKFVMDAISYILNMRADLDASELSLQETLCLMFLSAGENPDKCADLLGIKVNTVHTYEQRYRKKLGAKNRANAFYIAQVRKYITVTIN